MIRFWVNAAPSIDSVYCDQPEYARGDSFLCTVLASDDEKVESVTMGWTVLCSTCVLNNTTWMQGPMGTTDNGSTWEAMITLPINITTGGGPQMTVEDRMRPAMHFQPELASLNMGSMNFGLFPMLKKHNQLKFPWEKDMLERSKSSLFKNTFEDIENIMTLGYANGTRFEFECYDVGHLYNLHYFHREGMLKGPYFIQFVMGIMGGIGADADNLLHLKKTADKLFGDVGYEWSVVGAGASQMKMNATGAALGSHVRVGLEDSLWDGPGNLAKTNADQVKRVREILEGLSLEIATPDEARQMLGLKGKDKTNIN